MWDTDRARAYLGCSRWFLYQEVKAERIRAARVGNRLRFRPEWVVAYAEANATGPEVPETAEVGDAYEATVWQRLGFPRIGWTMDGAVGYAETGRQAPPPPAPRRQRSRGVEADAGRPGAQVELAVAAVDRKRHRRKLPRKVAG